MRVLSPVNRQALCNANCHRDIRQESMPISTQACRANDLAERASVLEDVFGNQLIVCRTAGAEQPQANFDLR